jgi:hypothetical protein
MCHGNALAAGSSRFADFPRHEMIIFGMVFLIEIRATIALSYALRTFLSFLGL